MLLMELCMSNTRREALLFGLASTGGLAFLSSGAGSKASGVPIWATGSIAIRSMLAIIPTPTC